MSGLARPETSVSESPARSGEIRALTGLRGLAALLVASYHVTGWGAAAPAPIAPLIRHGYLAVDLFFLLSGFLMARTYGERFAHGMGDYRWFLARRLARIYPAYAVAVLTFWLLVRLQWIGSMVHSGRSVGKLAIDLAMLQSLGFGPNLLPVSWSLSTEWIAYLLFPWLVMNALHRGVTRALLVALGAALGLAVILALPEPVAHGFLRTMRHAWLDVAETTTPWPLLRCLSEFSLGLLLWRALRARSATPRIAAAALAAALFAALGIFWLGALTDIFAVPAFLFLIAAIALDLDRAGVWLARGPIHALGVVSYSLYLVHLILWHILAPAGYRPMTALLVSLVVAAATYVLIERPGRRLVARLPAKRPDEPRGTPPSARRPSAPASPA